jgi:hypothetical protein
MGLRVLLVLVRSALTDVDQWMRADMVGAGAGAVADATLLTAAVPQLLWLHSDGANGPTTIVDSSGNGYTSAINGAGGVPDAST